MYVCTECGCVFESPRHWEERHGLDYGPYEQWSGCPNCCGSYVEAYICSCCGEYIAGDYIKLANDDRVCEDCYTPMELGDED